MSDMIGYDWLWSAVIGSYDNSNTLEDTQNGIVFCMGISHIILFKVKIKFKTMLCSNVSFFNYVDL